LALATKRLHPIVVHTGLYEKEDIIDLIEKQKVQLDSRITKQELDIVKHALNFGEKTVHDVMTPARMIKKVSVVDMIGPILMGELHESGHSRYPVYKEKPDNIVGTLYLRDALQAKQGGFVKDVMRKDVFFVNEQRDLAHVLDAFIKTKHHIFLVVNNFEEIVGLITLEDVIEQILGKPIMDEFDQYEDLRAVAQMDAEKDRETHETVVESEEVTEEPKEETHEDSEQRN
jgi:magnesium and cobalt transporter